ncbi:hypothetical protein ACNKF0_18870 [Nocardioides sp. T5]|uniref:hypothetical protein n=1 Tax=Nocardioides sp. T5 TaxID=3400182 RepID=UPI003A8A05CF
MTPDDATDATDTTGPADPVAPAAEREPEWKRRRRLAAVFGDGAPEQTSDDRDPREDRSGKGDDWYRDQVPPHHG